MKKVILMTLLATMTAAAQAQDKVQKTPQERAHARAERMARELGLSPEQQAKVEAIDLKYAEQARALRAEDEAQREAMRKEGKGKAIREGREAELKAVLTPEQYTKWQAKREEMKARHMEKRKPMPGDVKEKKELNEEK